MSQLFVRLYVLILCCVPGAAFAEQLTFKGEDDAWPIYLLGGGRALRDILVSISMFVSSPDFTEVLHIIAVIGVLVSGIAAGWDPGRNVSKLIAYILTVWLVGYASVGIKATVAIHDNYTGYYDVVTGVPAVVAAPVSFVTSIGHWLTAMVEKYLQLPSSSKLTGGGMYNMQATLLEDANKVVIQDTALRRTMSSYIESCVVMGAAMGQIDLAKAVKSSDFWGALKSDNPGLLTSFYPWTVYSSDGTESKATLGSSPTAGSTAFGQTASCQEVWTLVDNHLKQYGQQLVERGFGTWLSSGAGGAFATAFTDMLSWYGASDMSPASYVRQRAVLNFSTHAFKDAAMRTRNSELMTAMQYSIAEESQKSGWVAAASVSKNMMPYVFITLQGLFFAILPIVLIALMIPGFGLMLTKEYGRFLVWMVLWQPMLGVVNYLISVFGASELSGVLHNGLTVANQLVVSEKTNNLVIAAGFLGAMTPLLSWGLVKGTMAITEFLTHGVGMSFAMNAGAQAASGNLSMASMSMNNVSANKENWATQQVVGAMGSTVHAAAGSATMQFGAGGIGSTANASSATTGHSLGDSLASDKKITAGQGWDHSASGSIQASEARGHSRSFGIVENATFVLSANNGKGLTDSAGNQQQITTASSLATSAGESAGGSQGTLNDMHGQAGAAVRAQVAPAPPKKVEPGAGAEKVAFNTEPGEPQGGFIQTAAGVPGPISKAAKEQFAINGNGAFSAEAGVGKKAEVSAKQDASTNRSASDSTNTSETQNRALAAQEQVQNGRALADSKAASKSDSGSHTNNAADGRALSETVSNKVNVDSSVSQSNSRATTLNFSGTPLSGSQLRDAMLGASQGTPSLEAAAAAFSEQMSNRYAALANQTNVRYQANSQAATSAMVAAAREHTDIRQLTSNVYAENDKIADTARRDNAASTDNRRNDARDDARKNQERIAAEALRRQGQAVAIPLAGGLPDTFVPKAFGPARSAMELNNVDTNK